MESLDENTVVEIILRAVDFTSSETLIKSIDNLKCNDKWINTINNSTFLWKEIYKRFDLVLTNEFTAETAYEHLKSKKFIRIVKVNLTTDMKFTVWNNNLIVTVRNGSILDGLYIYDKNLNRIGMINGIHFVCSNNYAIYKNKSGDLHLFINSFANEIKIENSSEITPCKLRSTLIGLLLIHDVGNKLFVNKIEGNKLIPYKEFNDKDILISNSGIVSITNNKTIYESYDGKVFVDLDNVRTFEIQKGSIHDLFSHFGVFEIYEFWVIFDFNTQKTLSITTGKREHILRNEYMLMHDRIFYSDGRMEILPKELDETDNIHLMKVSDYPEHIIFYGSKI